MIPVVSIGGTGLLQFRNCFEVPLAILRIQQTQPKMCLGLIGAVIGFKVFLQLQFRRFQVIDLEVQHPKLKAQLGNMIRVSGLEVVLELRNRLLGLLLLNMQPAKAVMCIRSIFRVRSLQRRFQFPDGLLAVLSLLEQHPPMIVRESGVFLILGRKIILIKLRIGSQGYGVWLLRLSRQCGIAIFGAAPRGFNQVRRLWMLLNHRCKVGFGGNVISRLLGVNRQAEMHLVPMHHIVGFQISKISLLCWLQLPAGLMCPAQQVKRLSLMDRVSGFVIGVELADRVRILCGLHVQCAQPETGFGFVSRVSGFEIGVELADRLGHLLQFHVQGSQPEAGLCLISLVVCSQVGV